jgi:micrococcal nuclease
MHLHSRLARALVLGGVFALAGYQGAPAPAARYVITAEAGAAAADSCDVDSVIDGDTVWCEDGRRVRLIGIDAPETDQEPFGAAARDALERFAPTGAELDLSLDVVPTDRYRRTLAYLQTRDGIFINVAMVAAGYAVPLPIPPNVAHAHAIQDAANAARSAGAGLWGQAGFACPPSAHRSGRC